MCGIWALFGIKDDTACKCYAAFHEIKHRGPDASRFQTEEGFENSYFGFHRLTIISTPFGLQPMRLFQHRDVNLICNGELYNRTPLAEEFGFEYETGSDVECIIHLFKKFGIEKCAQNLDGVFAFCLVNLETKTIYLARDPYGVRPLFRLVTDAGILGVSSEAKGLTKVAEQLKDTKWYIEQFPPGTYAVYQMDSRSKVKLVKQAQYYEIGMRPKFTPWVKYESLGKNVSENIRALLTAAVEKRLMANRRIGCLLSGGLDSSLISALLVQLSKKHNLPYQVQSFSIGMGDESPDIRAARQVAAYIGTEHHEIQFTEKDIFEVLNEVIYTLETCDITTIRASLGMYLISKYIKQNTDTTIIFSGEGADELAQGYIYFRNAPTPEDGDKESKKLLSEIYLYDGLRADRTTCAHSLELRVPFLDQQFTNYFFSLSNKMRQPRDGMLEKYLIREAFNDTSLLPQNILWRHKEAFSDGVAHKKRSLFNVVQDWVEEKVSDADLADAKIRYPYLTPHTKESYYYRQVFEHFYPQQAEKLVPHFWMPNWTDVTDPSARFIKHYAAED